MSITVRVPSIGLSVGEEFESLGFSAEDEVGTLSISTAANTGALRALPTLTEGLGIWLDETVVKLASHVGNRLIERAHLRALSNIAPRRGKFRRSTSRVNQDARAEIEEQAAMFSL